LFSSEISSFDSNDRPEGCGGFCKYHGFGAVVQKVILKIKIIVFKKLGK